MLPTYASVVHCGATIAEKCQGCAALREPHLFRLMFGGEPAGVTPSEADDAEQRSPFEVLTRNVGLFLGRAPEAPETQRNALALWTFVHGLAALPNAPTFVDRGHGQID